MVKNIKIVASLVLLFSTLHYPLQAINSVTADVCAGLIAGLCVGSSYKIMNEMPGAIHPGVLCGVSCLVTAAGYHTLHKSTPAGRIKRANVLLTDVSRHTLARTCFNNEREFFDAVQDVYLTDDLPLISAYNHLLDLVPTMHYALCLINKASAEVCRDVLLQEECDASLSRATRLFSNISDAIKRIREHKDYLAQLSIYKESVFQGHQTIAQQDIAQAQQSSKFLKWLKFFLGVK